MFEVIVVVVGLVFINDLEKFIILLHSVTVTVTATVTVTVTDMLLLLLLLLLLIFNYDIHHFLL